MIAADDVLDAVYRAIKRGNTNIILGRGRLRPRLDASVSAIDRTRSLRRKE